MRLAGIFIAVVLAASASTAKADPLPFEIVRMLPETNQVLVYDRMHNTHVLLQPGSIFEDYAIIKVSELDMVVEKGQQRFTVYPREARLLSLTLFPRQLANPPIIYGKAQPAQTQVADTSATPAPVAPAVTTQIADPNAKPAEPQPTTLVVVDGPARAVPRAPLPLSTTVAPPRPVAKPVAH